MTCRLLTDFADVQVLASEWKRLWEANPDREVFGGFRWIESWWQAYGGDAQLLTPAVFQDGTCVGILPLVVHERTLRFVGYPATDYNDLLCEPANKADVLRAAIAALDDSPIPWEIGRLDDVPESSLLAAARNELPPGLRGRTGLTFSALCPTVLLDEGRAESLKSIVTKTTVSQSIRKFEKIGTLTFRHLEDRDEARGHLPSFYHQHIRCRALAGVRSQCLDQSGRDLFAALVENLDPRTDLRFSVLALDDRPIAYNFGFQLDGKFVLYSPTFDIEYFDLSPGQVLLRHLFLYAQDNGIREFDFTVGDEAYKSRYANHTRRNFALTLYPRTPKGRITHVGHAAQALLRSRPSLYRAAKTTIAAVQGAASRVTRILRRDGLARVASTSAVRLFRSAIYARDEVLVFTLKAPDKPTEMRGLTFREGSLSDLADAVTTFPDYLGDSTLHDLRKRLKQGHKPFVVLDNDNVVHIVWYRVDDRLATAELGWDFAFMFGRPTGIMYDARTPLAARGKGVYPIALSLLAQQVAKDGYEPIGYVQTDNIASRRGSEKLGMVLRGRMIRRVWFHWIRRCETR